MQGLRIIFFIFMVFLIVSQLVCFCKINGAKIDKTKSKEPKEILKKMITDLEKCAKTNKNEATKLVQKCLSDIKKLKNLQINILHFILELTRIGKEAMKKINYRLKI